MRGRLKSTLVGTVGCTSWLYTNQVPEGGRAASLTARPSCTQPSLPFKQLQPAERLKHAIWRGTAPETTYEANCLTVPNPAYLVSSRVPPFPPVPSCAQPRRLSCPLVSSRVLLVPRMRDISVTRLPPRARDEPSVTNRTPRQRFAPQPSPLGDPQPDSSTSEGSPRDQRPNPNCGQAGLRCTGTKAHNRPSNERSKSSSYNAGDRVPRPKVRVVASAHSDP